MLIDTHCHLNICAKEDFDVPLTPENLISAQRINNEAIQAQVKILINVGTSLIESKNCLLLADTLSNNYAVIGIHPNDMTSSWQEDLQAIEKMVRDPKNRKIVGIGETGIDHHYPDYNKQRQRDAFIAQIELALEYDLALVVHSRDAYDETLRCLEPYAGQSKGVIHCFSYDSIFARTVIDWGMVIGIGGPVTYPNNHQLREVVQTISLESIILETDAPFLPPQIIRGQKNHPKYIALIAQYIAQLRSIPVPDFAQVTMQNVQRIFKKIEIELY